MGGPFGHPFDDPYQVPRDYGGPLGNPGWVDPAVYVGPNQGQNFDDYHYDASRREQESYDIARRGGQRSGTSLSPASIAANQLRAQQAASRAAEEEAIRAKHQAQVNRIVSKYGSDSGRRSELSRNERWINTNGSNWHLDEGGGAVTGAIVWGVISVLVGLFLSDVGALGVTIIVLGAAMLAFALFHGLARFRVVRIVNNLRAENEVLVSQIGCGRRGCMECQLSQTRT